MRLGSVVRVRVRVRVSGWWEGWVAGACARARGGGWAVVTLGERVVRRRGTPGRPPCSRPEDTRLVRD